MESLWKRLNEPFPEQDSWKDALSEALTAGLIVAIMLYFLQPGGMRFASPRANVVLGCLAFGCLTVLVTIAYALIGKYVFKIRKDLPSWTLKKWIGSVLVLVVVIAIANFILLNIMQDWQAIRLEVLWQVVSSTFFIALFPVTFFGFSAQLKARNENEKEALHIQSHLRAREKDRMLVSLPSQNASQEFELDLADFYYAEAMQNYVAVHYRLGEEMKRELLRNTIANLEQHLSGHSIIRCHRSYLVNLALVEQVSGNAQGLRLDLSDLPDVQVPVSRKYIATLRAELD